MDYEKAYKEALERAKDIKNGSCPRDGSIATADYIFPELRENEDERIRKELIEAFEAYDVESSWNLIPVKHILAWLEKQKEQKPAEWSEEDEDNLKAIIRIIEDNDSDWKELTDWLNSLHDNYKKCNSRWKPSEEQMSMLLAVINDPNNAGAESCQLALKSLYEQLKKLK